MSPRRFALVLPVRTQSLSNMREYWRRRHERSQNERLHTRAAWLKARAQRLAPGEMAAVHLVRVGPQLLDDDNLPASLKTIRDELADLLLPGRRAGAADRDPRIRWTYGQQRGLAREYAVRIEITITSTEAA